MKKIIYNYSWLIIPLLFLLYSAPGALDYIFHFPDEKYYTDSVLQMIDKQDYLTPYQANGNPRFLKPILTYWVLIGSYNLFGVNKVSSRLFFWLAGALLVLVIYFMTKSLTKNRKTAQTASLIAAANPLILMSASRSIPDIFLGLFLAISSWGFLEIMISSKPSSRSYWLAYLGAALAFETKGIPAAAFAGINILYILFNPWQRKKLSQLIHPSSIIVSLIIALSWYIAIYLKHGTTFLSSFFADQIGERVSSRISQFTINSSLGIINLIAFTFPWILIAFSNPKKLKLYFSSLSHKEKSIFGFIATWIIMIIIMSGVVFKFYDRYLLPVIPLTSLFFALILNNTDTRFAKPTQKIFSGLTIFLLIICIFYSIFIYTDTVLIFGTTFGIIAFFLLQKNFFKHLSFYTILSNTIMLLWFTLNILLYPILLPNAGKQLVDTIKKEQTTGEETIYVYGNIRTASNIRIHSHHKMDVISMDTIYTLPSNQNHLLVFGQKEKPFLNLENYDIQIGSEEFTRVPPQKFPAFLQPVINKIKNKGKKYYVASPK